MCLDIVAWEHEPQKNGKRINGARRGRKMHHHICGICGRTRAHKNNGVCEEVPYAHFKCSLKCFNLYYWMLEYA